MHSPLVVSPLCAFGHVATYQELHELWGAESTVVPFRRLYGRRAVLWLRPNAYACAHLGDDELLAARVGAHLDCVSVLSAAGSDSATRALAGSGAVHVRLAPNDGRASARRLAEPRPVVAHWSVPRNSPPDIAATHAAITSGGAPISRVSLPVPEALRQALRSCLSPDDAVVVIAELLAIGALGTDELACIVASSPRRVRAGLRHAGLAADVVDALESFR
ncbi:hypothetical protein [Gryllotalpicola protaetiae]|uniref:AbiEi antitoxin C-terminal domain-containing protein n=1 Tax=Gryllotalpicola protaetiae TaxID=2419771 RepID=A0A387BEZ5_9MICO|nr:hypothetical protein [Gryllotalpicola protaetiae]AYG02555.1 hypothetical protein D7I44_02785 [Gryllotalpicola protaetiae]